MDTVRIKILGRASSEEEYKEELVFRLLQKHFHVEICENPDFLICGASYGKQFEYAKYNGVRIYMGYGENTPPDFSSYDYVFGYDDCTLEDRFCRYFLFLNYFWRFSEEELKAFDNHLYDTRNEKPREFFCDFIYSHPSAHGVREELLHRLQDYKRVECAGSFQNNMIDLYRCKDYAEKKRFQERCKFSIACESVKQSGFTTEKILQPFLAGSIPIYFGNPNISSIFNEKAFINVHSFPSVQDAVEYVKYVDSNDDLYQQMLHEPVFVDNDLPYKMLRGFEEQLVYIFSQKPEDAIRRPMFFTGAKADIARLQYWEITESVNYKWWRKYRKLLYLLGLSKRYKSIL